jgi:hypothetical protein
MTLLRRLDSKVALPPGRVFDQFHCIKEELSLRSQKPTTITFTSYLAKTDFNIIFTACSVEVFEPKLRVHFLFPT